MEFNNSAFQTPEDNREPVFFLNPIGLNYEELDFSPEEKLYNKLTSFSGRDHMESLIAQENFDFKTIQFDFGSRVCGYPNSEEIYKNLLISRSGVDISATQPFQTSLKNFISLSAKIEESDRMRISEIKAINDKITEMYETFRERAVSSEDREAVQRAFLEKDTSFVHLGFRSLNLINFYKNDGFEKTLGLDINELTVDITKKLGEDARVLNMNCDAPIEALDCDLLVAYHVLECTPNPLGFLKRLSTALRPGTKLHFEVTIEPGQPRVRYAHLFPFEKGDLQDMLAEAGFIPISLSNIPHPGGPEIERVMALSK